MAKAAGPEKVDKFIFLGSVIAVDAKTRTGKSRTTFSTLMDLKPGGPPLTILRKCRLLKPLLKAHP